MELDADLCFRASRSGDPRFDGRFFIGVTSTGIYCRPVCRVRPPKRENMRFYPNAAAAEAAGFRPCLRCRPEAAPGSPAWNGNSELVSRALRRINAGALDRAEVEDLAASLGITGRQLRRLFAEQVGASPAEVARARRIHFARRLVVETRLPMQHVAATAGFGSVRQFNHAMRASFGRSPRELRKAKRQPQNGNDQLSFRLPYRPPLDWPALLAYLQPRLAPGVEAIGGLTYRRLWGGAAEPALIEVTAGEDDRSLQLRVEPATTPELMAIVSTARRVFDLDADPLAIDAHLSADPRLAPLVERRPGVRVPGSWDSFQLAVRAVLGQGVSVAAADRLMGRFVEELGTPVPGFEDRGVTHRFPTPDQVARAGLAGLGVPAQRQAALKGLARALVTGAVTLDASRSLEQLVDDLSRIPGVGPWTAHYIAMRACGEPDAFPAADLGLRDALSHGNGRIATAAAARLADAWRPWRAYAAMQLWLSLAAGRDASGSRDNHQQHPSFPPAGKARPRRAREPNAAAALLRSRRKQRHTSPNDPRRKNQLTLPPGGEGPRREASRG